MKYKLLEKEENGLCRIEALKDFNNVKKGDIGGYVESEDNLSQNGNSWVSGNARVYGNAIVSGNAEVSGNAIVYGNAEVSGNAIVYGDAVATRKVINIELTYNITLTDNHITIGCKQFTFKKALKLNSRWKNILENIDEAKEIEKYRKIIVELIKYKIKELENE